MTYFLLLAAALAVAALGWGVRRHSAFWGQALIALGCLGCVGGLGWQIRASLFAPGPKPVNRAHSVVSYYLATQTQQAVAGQVGVVVVILDSPKTLDPEAATMYANTFRAPFLRGHPEWTVETFMLTPPAKGESPEVAARAGFKQAFAKFPSALAYIAYTRIPADFADVLPAASVPPIFVFDPAGTAHWLPALKQGRVRSVIVPRPGVEAGAMAGVAGGPGELFSQFYLLALPANAEQIAAQLRAP